MNDSTELDRLWNSSDLGWLMRMDMNAGRSFGEFWQHIWSHNWSCAETCNDGLFGLDLYTWKDRPDAHWSALWELVKRQWNYERAACRRTLERNPQVSDRLLCGFRARATAAPAPRLAWAQTPMGQR